MKKWFTQLLFSFWVVSACAFQVDAADFLIVVDSSGSMSEPTTDGQQKMVAAKQALRALRSDLAAHNVGMTLFGHRLDPQTQGSCQDVETVLPISDFVPEEYDRVVSQLKPKGNTPLAEALRHATTDLMFREKSASKIVIVLTDGNETCGGDPIAIAEKMRALGINVKLHVIGFAVKPEEEQQLKELAQAGGGEFGLAQTQTDLESLMRKQIDSSAILVSKPTPKPAKKLNPIQKALVNRLTDADRDVRTSAANTLLKMNVTAAADAVFERVQVEADNYYAWPAAFAALEGLAPQKVDAALELAIASEERNVAVSAIAKSGERKSHSTANSLSGIDKALTKALEAEHRDVRTAAAQALQKRSVSLAIPFLAKRVLTEQDGYYAWPAALWALNSLSPETAMNTIVEAMDSNDKKIRNLATDYAAKLMESNS